MLGEKRGFIIMYTKTAASSLLARFAIKHYTRQQPTCNAQHVRQQLVCNPSETGIFRLSFAWDDHLSSKLLQHSYIEESSPYLKLHVDRTFAPIAGCDTWSPSPAEESTSFKPPRAPPRYWWSRIEGRSPTAPAITRTPLYSTLQRQK